MRHSYYSVENDRGLVETSCFTVHFYCQMFYEIATDKSFTYLIKNRVERDN